MASTQQRAWRATVVRHHRLTSEDSPQETRHVELSWDEESIPYAPGDCLGVLPTNPRQLVDEFVLGLGVTGGELVPDGGGRFRLLREVLKTDYNLARATPTWVELLARSSPPGTRVDGVPVGGQFALGEFEASQFAGCDVVETLEQFPSARPTLGEVLASLAPVQPRFYPISSSPLAHPGLVHLTARVARFEALSRWRGDQETAFLGTACQPGDPVRVVLRDSPHFRLPSDHSRSLIMIATGTGIAPFHSFLCERQAAGATGRHWLFFGSRYSGHDDLYRDRLSEWTRSGWLQRLDLAFSRDHLTKVYVQHRMAEQGEELWRWLSDGAFVYVSGDARRMAPDVERCLLQIFSQHGGKTRSQARDYLEELTQTRRYQRDVF